jgi:hypothetical protein
MPTDPQRSQTTIWRRINWNVVLFAIGILGILAIAPAAIIQAIRDRRACPEGTVLMNVPYGRACVAGSYLK